MLPEQAAHVVCTRMAFSGEANNCSLKRKEIHIPVVRSLYLTPFYDGRVQIPVIPEDIFFTSEFTEMAKLAESDDNSAELVSETFHQVVFSHAMYKLLFFIHTSGLLVMFQDNIALVDQQLLYTCCPFLGKCLPEHRQRRFCVTFPSPVC